MMFSKVHKAVLGLIVLAAFSPATAYADDEIRIDFPAGGQLKVRNDFGDVTVEVWSNNHVAVSAIIGGDGSKRLTRSPIIIDNRGSLITISVVRRPVDPAHLAHVLQRGGADLLGGGRWREVVQDANVAAHERQYSYIAVQNAARSG